MGGFINSMEHEVAEVMLNMITSEKRIEITVITKAGEKIVFPHGQVETRQKAGSRDTIHACAQKTESLPFPRTFTFLMQDEAGYPPRYKLSEAPA